MAEYVFTAPLTEGVIRKRKSQFTMSVEVNGEVSDCHCPTTGRIGNIEVNGRPCLLSRSSDHARKTPYTVEAVSLDRPEETAKSWFGINQNAVNRYVEHYLTNGGFSDIIVTDGEVHRERSLGTSKLDFLAGDTYIEVKMPLVSLQLDIPDHVRTKKSAQFSSTDRFIKHITDLAKSLQDHQRAILLTCFIYDNPGFKVIERSIEHEHVRATVETAERAGVELWQANFKISPYGVELVKYFRFQADGV
jgi:sugar fermentation stimulation protein A